MSDFSTVLCQPAIIADITDQEVFAVKDGPAQSTYQQFSAVTSSNSQIVGNIQIPSENIVIDREVLCQSTLAFTLNLGSATQAAYQVPYGQKCVQWGLDTCVNAFPLMSCMNTLQSTINNVGVNINLSDVKDILLRLYDRRQLQRYQSFTPCYPDTAYAYYANALLTNNNPLAGYNVASYDSDFMPRGAFAGQLGNVGMSMVLNHYVGGVLTDNSPTSTAVTDTWQLQISNYTVTEPLLFMSPYINCCPNNRAGFIGINTLSIVMNVNSTLNRLITTANPYITSITPGAGAISTMFNSTKFLFNFLSLNPEQYAKLSTRNCVPYYEVPRYLTVFNSANPITSGSTSTLTSQSIQLAQVPDLVLIAARVPLASQTAQNTNSWLAINSISLNFNNTSGILSSATQVDLWRLSCENGLNMSFYEWCGQAAVNNPTTGLFSSIATTGSILVLDPVKNFQLPPYLSASSLGQFQLQWNLGVFNQYNSSITPEMICITLNSGIFCVQQGTAQAYTGVLTKSLCLDTKSQQKPVPQLEEGEYQRLVGAGIQDMHSAARGYMKKRGGVIVGGVDVGGVNVGGARVSDMGDMDGGKRKSRMARHLM